MVLALCVNWCIPLLSVVLIDDGPQCCEFDAAKSVTPLPHTRGTLKLYPHRKLTENRKRHVEWLMMMCGGEEGGGKRQKLDDEGRYRVTSFLPIVHSQVPPHTLILGKCNFHSKSFETRYITMHKTNDCPFIFKELCQAWPRTGSVNTTPMPVMPSGGLLGRLSTLEEEAQILKMIGPISSRRNLQNQSLTVYKIRQPQFSATRTRSRGWRRLGSLSGMWSGSATSETAMTTQSRTANQMTSGGLLKKISHQFDE